MLCADALSLAGGTDDVVNELSEVLAHAGVDSPQLMFLSVTPHHAERIEVIRDALRDRFRAEHFVGVTAAGLIARGREIEAGPGAVAFALQSPGIECFPYHSTSQPNGDESAEILGFPYERLAGDANATCLMLADPFSFPIDPFVRSVNERCPRRAIVGGLASGGTQPGMNRLVIDDASETEGAVGVLISGTVSVRTVVSQGCRPVGHHFVITRGKDNVIEELGGKRAAERLQEVFDSMPTRDRQLFSKAVHIGRVIDEYKSDFGRSDFLVRSVIGIDRSRGAIAINDYIRRGQTVQFLVRDPESASEDLALLLAEQSSFLSTHPPKGALLFSCNGRGRNMFAERDHDVKRVSALGAAVPVAGFFAAGEIGPVGGSNFFHGFTASIAIFHESSPTG